MATKRNAAASAANAPVPGLEGDPVFVENIEVAPTADVDTEADASVDNAGAELSARSPIRDFVIDDAAMEKIRKAQGAELAAAGVADNAAAPATSAGVTLSTLRANTKVYAAPSGGGLFASLQSHRERLAASLPPAGEHRLTVEEVVLHTGRTDPEPHSLAMLTCSVEGFPDGSVTAWFKLPEPEHEYADLKLLRQVLRDLDQVARIAETADVVIDTLDDVYELAGIPFRAKINRRVDRDGLPTATIATVVKLTPAPAAK